jgi:hypothetical protein
MVLQYYMFKSEQVNVFTIFSFKQSKYINIEKVVFLK